VKRDDTKDPEEEGPAALEPAPLDRTEDRAPGGLDRRVFLGLSLTALPAVRFAAATARAAGKVATHGKTAGPAVARSTTPSTMPVTLNVNGQEQSLQIDPRASLLDTLREEIGLTGTKKGCDHGQCGACTVLIDDRRVLSCLTLAAMTAGRRVTTVEGLAQGDQLHPVQAAFVKHDAFQCGFCTPGQIVSAVGLLHEGCPDDPAAIRECMSGNLCRCGAYPNIVEAVREARGGKSA
jgi:xanthine dehydrogenase YagT iron-sulfur-binding subunit